MKLFDVEENQTVIITKINCAPKIIEILNDFGIVPLTSVKIIKKAPFHGAIAIYSRGFTFAIRSCDAKLIEVINEL